MPKILSDIAAAAQTGITHAKLRYVRTTTRERFLLAILILGAVLYAPVHALGAMNQESEAYVDALGDQTTARISAQAARRLAASVSDQVALEDMKSWGFSALNADVAKVIIEHRLSQAADRAGMANPIVTVDPAVLIEGPTYWISAEIVSDLRWDPAFAMIEELGAWTEGFRVTGFKYEIQAAPRSSRNTAVPPTEAGKIYFTLAFPVQLEEMPEDTTAARNPAREQRS